MKRKFKLYFVVSGGQIVEMEQNSEISKFEKKRSGERIPGTNVHFKKEPKRWAGSHNESQAHVL